jgi:hypothetical protein
LWSNGIDDTGQYGVYNRDFRFLGGAIFSTIASLCQVSSTAINNNLLDFGESSFVTVQILPKNQLVEQGKSIIDLFISTSENKFVILLQTIRDTTQANSLLSGLATSTAVKVKANDPTNIQLVTRPKLYNMTSSCSCYTNPTCIGPAGLFTLSNLSLYYPIPGFFTGCYIVEATLQSNLGILYNQNWIDDFREKIHLNNFSFVPIETIALNASYKSQYNTTTPINIMMQKMMTEPWIADVNYSAYFEQCQPIDCKYTYTVKYDFIYMITTVIGLIGGLTTILQIVISYAVILIRRYWFHLCHRTRIHVITVEISVEHNIH